MRSCAYAGSSTAIYAWPRRSWNSRRPPRFDPVPPRRAWARRAGGCRSASPGTAPRTATSSASTCSRRSARHLEADGNKVETVRGGGLSCALARGPGEQRLEVLQRAPPPTDLEHRPHQHPDLIAHERRRLDLKRQQPGVVPAPGAGADAALERQGVGGGGGKGGEVVLPPQGGRRGVELPGVEPVAPPESPPLLERVANGRREHPVA